MFWLDDAFFDDYGLEKIEVCDNGCGVNASNVPFMVKRHFTSKLVKAEDLAALETYGFRGEALASLCAVSSLSITTKTAEEDISHIYTFGNDGNILDKKPSHVSKGTIICARKLFSNLPVRKQYYSNDQRKKDDLKKIENLIMAYSIVKPALRITLKHGKDVVFQKTALKDTKQVLHLVFGRQVANQLIYRSKTVDDPKLSVTAFLPKPGSDVKELSLSSADRSFLIVNERPVFLPELNRVLKAYYSNCHALDNARFPICSVMLNLPLSDVDVNVDPNKTKIFLQHKSEVTTCLEEILLEVYGPLDDVPSWHYVESESHTATVNKETKTSHQDQPHKTHCIMYKSTPSEIVTRDENISVDTSDNVVDESQRLPIQEKVVDVIVIPEEPISSDFVTNTDSVSDVILSDCGEKGTNPCTVIAVDCENNEIGSVKAMETLTNSSLIHKASDGEIIAGATCPSDRPYKCNGTSLTDENVVASGGDQVTESTSCDTVPVETVIHVKDSEDGDSKINTDTWTRGTLNSGTGPSLLQPVKLLPPCSKHVPGCKRPSSEDESTISHPTKRKCFSDNPLPPTQPTLYEALNVQPPKKHDSAFNFFCNEKKPMYEADGMCGNVDERLREAWDNLDEEDKITYRQMCWTNVKRYEKEVKMASHKNKTKETNARDEIASLASQSQAQKVKKKLKNRLYSKEIIAPWTLHKLRKYFYLQQCDNNKDQGDSPPPLVIGQAKSCDAWFCTVKKKLCLLNIHRLMELDVYNKLRAEHILPSSLCEPIPLDSSILGANLIITLEELAKASQTSDMYYLINDKRLIANGFKVKCHLDSDENVKMELLEICKAIPTYDVSDMKFVLEILSHNPGAQLEETRSSKALYYLQGEAVRITRQSKSFRTREDIQDLLSRKTDLLNKNCLHEKAVVHDLINLSDLESE